MIRNIILAITSLSLLIPAALVAQPVSDEGQFPMRRRAFMKELNLSNEQEQQIEKLRTGLMKEMVDHRAKTATARLELRELSQAETVDRAAVEKKVNEISQLHAKQQTRMIDHWFSVNKILKPDQQKIWKRTLGLGMFMGQGPGFGRGMRGGRMGPGMGVRPMRMQRHQMPED